MQWVELPGFQNMLNVWQPRYTHMFERVMAGPKPWLFGHLHLPGGTANLGKPGTGLDWRTSSNLGEKKDHAPVIGTLMQVLHFIKSPNKL